MPQDYPHSPQERHWAEQVRNWENDEQSERDLPPPALWRRLQAGLPAPSPIGWRWWPLAVLITGLLGLAWWWLRQTDEGTLGPTPQTEVASKNHRLNQVFAFQPAGSEVLPSPPFVAADIRATPHAKEPSAAPAAVDSPQRDTRGTAPARDAAVAANLTGPGQAPAPAPDPVEPGEASKSVAPLPSLPPTPLSAPAPKLSAIPVLAAVRAGVPPNDVASLLPGRAFTVSTAPYSPEFTIEELAAPRPGHWFAGLYLAPSFHSYKWTREMQQRTATTWSPAYGLQFGRHFNRRLWSEAGWQYQQTQLDQRSVYLRQFDPDTETVDGDVSVSQYALSASYPEGDAEVEVRLERPNQQMLVRGESVRINMHSQQRQRFHRFNLAMGYEFLPAGRFRLGLLAGGALIAVSTEQRVRELSILHPRLRLRQWEWGRDATSEKSWQVEGMLGLRLGVHLGGRATLYAQPTWRTDHLAANDGAQQFSVQLGMQWAW